MNVFFFIQPVLIHVVLEFFFYIKVPFIHIFPLNSISVIFKPLLVLYYFGELTAPQSAE